MRNTKNSIIHLVILLFVMVLAVSVTLPVNAKVGVSNTTKRYYFKNVVNTVDLHDRDTLDVPYLYDKQNDDREIDTDYCNWTSSNPKVARINTYGGGTSKEFVFKKPGTVTFTCTYAGEKISIKYKVLKNAKKGYINYSEKILTVDDIYEDDISVIYQGYPKNTYPNKKKVVWKSSNNKVIKPVKRHYSIRTISKFSTLLKAKKPGKAVLTCKV